MAEEVINLDELIKGNPKRLEAYVKATSQLETVLESLTGVVKNNKAEFDTLKATLGSSNQITKEQIALINKVAKEFEGLVAKSKANTEASSTLERAKKRLNNLYKEEGKLLVETQQKIAARRKEVKEAIAAENLHETSLVRMRQRLNEARREFDKLSESERKAKTSGGLLRKEIQSLDTNIRKLEASTGRMQRNVGNYTRSVKDAIGTQTGFNLALSKTQIAAGIVAGIMVKLFNVFSSFEKQNAKLAGVLGKTVGEIRALKENAKELGRTTAFTSTQVAQLQTELAKLGFTETEIVNATGAILDLAVAASTDLSNAAEIAGTTIRGLGISTTQTRKVVDVMTKSFSTSALDITKWKESIKFVGPIAREAGVSVEELAALMGTLADAGISGSNAGTALRRVLTEIGKTGKPVGEALEELSEKGLSLADAQDEVGRTAQTALIVLSKNTDKIKGLTEAYKDAGGTAKKLSEEQLKTLTGRVTLLTSAFDGLLLKMEDGEGIIGSFSKAAVDALTWVVQGLSSLDTGVYLLFNDLSEASDKAINDILKFGETARGNKVSDVLEEAFKGVSNADFIKNAGANYVKFLETLQAEGEKVEDIAAVWKVYKQNRIEAAQADQQAAKDSLNAAKELEENRKLQEEAQNNKANAEQRQKLREKEEELKMRAASLSIDISKAITDSIDISFDTDIVNEWQQRLDDFGKAERTVKGKDGFFQMLGIDKVMYDEEKEQFEENEDALKDGEKAMDGYKKATKKSTDELVSMGINAITSAKDFEGAVKNIGNSSRDLIKAKVAEAIANTIANSSKIPPPASVILGGIAAAGFIALFDKFLPKFKRGTKNSPAGPAIVNEEGREAFLTKKGEFGLLGSGKGGAEVVNLESGMQIFPHKETNHMLESLMAMSESSAIQKHATMGLNTVRNREKQTIQVNNKIPEGQIKQAIQKGIKEGLAEGFSRLPIHNTNITERGLIHTVTKGNQRVITQKKDNQF